jgi:hypothetical protein
MLLEIKEFERFVVEFGESMNPFASRLRTRSETAIARSDATTFACVGMCRWSQFDEVLIHA